MKIKELLAAITRVAAAIAAACALSISAHAQCNIYMSTNQQAIDGYGFSSAWSGTLTTAKNNALYGTLGMSLLRVQIDPGGNWAGEATNAAAAHAGGAKVLGSSWSAPAAWTTTGNAYSGELLPADYANYANWLSNAVTAHKLDWVSPANEPDIGWMSWTTNEYISWIGQYGGSLGAPLLAAESFSFNDTYTDAIIDDPVAGPNVSVVGGHGYFYGSPWVHTDPISQGKHVWMTEYYLTGGQDTIGESMALAQEMSDYMNCQFSAYISWWVPDSDTNCNLVYSDGTIYKIGYTMGQFAKWVRPGSTRVSSDYNPQTGVSVTAYKVTNNVVIVAVNTNTYAVNQQFVINNGSGAPLEGYRTSSSEGMADIGSFTVSGGSFTPNLPAQSITTFVQNGVVPTGLSATAVATNQINLTWNATANATSYNVQRSLTNGGPYTVIASGVTATSYNDTGLAGGTMYYYVVSAMISGYETPNSAQASAATLSPTFGSLAHRYSFQESGGTNTADSIGGPVWTGTLPNGGTLANGSLTITTNGHQYAALPAGIVSQLTACTIIGWVNPTVFYAGNRLFDFGNGQTAYLYINLNYTGNVPRFGISTNGFGSEQSVSGSAALTTSVWHQVAITLDGVSTAVLYVDGRPVGTNSGMTIKPSNLGNTVNNWLGRSEFEAYGDTTLVGLLDEFRIYNRALAGAEVATAYALGASQLPVVSGLTATGAATNQINLAWNALTNATSYNVKRSPTDGGPYTVIASSVNATSYNDAGLAGGTKYYYVVSAQFSGNESDNSVQVSAATLSPTFGSLAHRYSFQESGGTNTADSIGGPVWTGTLPNGGTLANGSLTITTNGHQYAALPAGIVSQLTACTIIGWVNPTVFYAGNRLFDFGNGQTAYLYINLNYTGNVPRFGISTNGFGSEQSVSGSAALTTSVWHQVAITLDGVSTAVLYVDGRPVGTNSGMTIKPSNLGNTVNNWLGRSEFEAYGDTTLVGLLDEFRIYNRALAGAEVATAYALGASQLPVVSGLTATGAATNQINLAWNALTNATSYNVKRSLTNGGPYTVIASGVTATNYADSAGLAGVTTYYYVVSALLSGTESDNSAQAAAATLSPFAYFWGSPVSFAGLNAGQILTNFPGTAVVAAMFAQNGGSSITVTLGGSSIVFAPANTSWASLSGGTGFSTGASTNATGNTNFDSCLNAFYYDTGPHLITLSNLVVGRSYSVQLFALDDRSLSPAGSARTVNWQNPADSSNVSPTYSMADNKYIVMTFVATNVVQVIQENLLNSGCGNFNCLVLRAVMVPGTVTLGNLNQTYDGTAKSASATTTPTNLTVNITYNGSANAPTNAGSYTVIGTINDTYYQGSVTNVLVINQAAGTVTLSNLTQTYDGTAKSASATTTPSGLTVNLTYNGSANAPTNAGSYAVIGTINDVNYQGSATNTLVISKGTGTVTLGSLSQTYNGTAKSASATTAPSGLTVNLTYNGSANAPTNAGSYAVIGTINDVNYQGGVTNTLVINKGAGTVNLGSLSQTYDGTAKSASASTTPSGLTVNLTYGGSANAPTNAGSYTVIGTISDVNYQGSATNTLVISKGAGTVTLSNLSQTYDGAAKSATATTTPTNLTVNLTYGGLANAPTNVGSYTVIGTITDANYQGGATNTLVISKGAGAVTLSNLSQTYDGTAKSATATTTPSGLTVNLTYGGSANAPTNAGSYTVIGTISDANYQGSATNTLVISKGAGAVTLGSLSQTYDGAAKSATATTTPTNLTVNLTYNGSANAPTNAGSYTVIGTISDANYQGSATNTLVISKGTGTVTLGNLSQTYDGTAKSASATTTPSGLTVSITYNGSANAPTNAGSYTVIGTISDANYQGSATNTLVISKGTGTVTLGNLSQTYDGAAKSVSATTTPTNLTVNITYNGSANAPTNAGSYTVVGTITDANYQGGATNTLVISKGAGTVTLSNLSQTYDGAAKSASATTTPSGLTVNLTYGGSANAPTNAGSYTVIGTIADANYQGSATNTLVISKGAGTVTLSNLSQTYDGAAKSATATTTPTNLTVNLTYSGLANAPTNAGSYTVIGTISDANYQGSATNTLVISKGAGTVTLSNLSQTYDGAAKSASATTTPSGLTVNLTYGGSVNAPTNAGSYTVIGTITDVNYQGSATNTLVISKGAGAVTLSNLSQTYDGAAKSVTATTTPTNLTVNLTYSGLANAPTNAGSYTVIGTISDANYQGSATNTLVISKGAGTVTLSNLSQTYDGAAKSATATTTPSGLTVNLTYNGSANAPTNAGSYTVIGTISDANYQGSATNTLVISKGAGAVTLSNLSQTYDGAAKSVTATTTPTNLTVNLTYSGLANAPTNAGSYTVIGTIADANYQGSATNTLVISKGAGTVTLGSLSQTYDGAAKSASATTTPTNLTVNLTYNGSANAPTNAGSYTVIGTINDVNYQGSATNTLVISKGTGTVTLGNLSQTYDGTAKSATATTTPTNLTVNLTYSGLANAPTNAGSYTVIGTINDVNYQGSVTNTLVISKGAGTVTLGSLSQTYDGTAKSASATTTPSGMTVSITYSNSVYALSANAPTNAGSYTVIGTINNTNWLGSTNGTLVINQGAGTVTLGGLSQTYDGTAKSASATTTPSGLTVNITYSNSVYALSANAPTNAGSYTVIGTINNTNWLGSTNGTLVISQGAGTVTLGNLSQTYDGAAKSATATTTPTNLTVNLTYSNSVYALSANAPTNVGSYTVIGTINNTNWLGSTNGTLVINQGAGTVTLGSLSQTYNGAAKSVTATTTPGGLTVNLTYSNSVYALSANAPTNAGSYTVIGTINNTNWLGSTNGTLVINKGAGTVTLGSLSQTYDGMAKSASATTTPSGLTVSITYSNSVYALSANAPTNAGSYTVIATISNTNWQGSATNTLVISSASRPQMSLALTRTNLAVSWPTNASTGYTLQSCTNLTLGNWLSVTSPAALNVGSNWQVSLPPATNAGAMFYRLMK